MENGARPQIDRTRADIVEQAAAIDVANADTRRLTDLAGLAGALALDPSDPIRLVQPAELSVDEDPSHAAQVAGSARPEVIAAMAHVTAAASQVRAARSVYRPSLFVSGALGTGYSYNAAPGTAATPNAPAQPPITYGGPVASATTTVGLNAPIFDPTIAPGLRQALVSLEIADAMLAQQLIAVRTDAVQAAIQVRAARQALASAARLAETASANLHAAQGRYENGAATLLELVDAQGADASARLGIVRARWQLELAKVRLLTSLGQLSCLDNT